MLHQCHIYFLMAAKVLHNDVPEDTFCLYQWLSFLCSQEGKVLFNIYGWGEYSLMVWEETQYTTCQARTAA